MSKILPVLSFLLLLPISQQAQQIKLAVMDYIFINNAGDSIPAELGTFEVPENRHKADSKKLKIKFVRFKSTNPNPGSPIVYLAGGPGGSGINAAKHNRFKLFMSMRSIGDVIAYDQRGTGLSDGPPGYIGFWRNDISAPTDMEISNNLIAEETLKAADYFESQGTDLSGYNTNENSDDLNDLRLALGVEKISLWGISYGSHLALTTLKRHEKHLDKIIIAGVEGYDHTVKMPNDQQSLLEEIDRRLKSDPKTRRYFPDFLGDIETLLERLDKESIIATSINPFNNKEMEVVIGKLDMQMILAWSLRGPSTFKGVPLLVQQLLKGNSEGLSEYALYTHLGRFRGMSMAMDVASGISPERLAKLKQEAQTTLLGDAINFPFLIQWEALKHLDLGDDFRQPYPSNLPVLCISGTLDGRTAVNNAIETLEHLSNGKHLIIDGAGHSDPLFLSSPRIEEVMLDFMKGKEVKNETIFLEPMAFDLPEK